MSAPYSVRQSRTYGQRNHAPRKRPPVRLSTSDDMAIPRAASTMLSLQRLLGNARIARELAHHPAAIQRLLIDRGERGDTVLQVQQLLNGAKPAPEPPLDVDGIFGKRTESAVREFQRRNGLGVDGIVGNDTWSILTGHKSAPQKETKPAAPTTKEEAKPGAEKVDAPKIDSGQIASGIESVVDKAVGVLSGSPGDDLAPNFVTTELNAIFKEFTEVSVLVRGTAERAVVPPRAVKVHTPYYINVNEESAALSKEVAAAAKSERAKSPVQKFFKHVASKESGLGRALIGKASPEMIREIAQSALDQGLIQPQDATHPTGKELESWLRTHGVGVDCSGFVSQALTHLMEKQRHAAGLEGPVKEIYLGSKGLKGGSKDFAKVGADKACKGPKCLAPGDTMYLPGHIRIVVSVEPSGDGVEFSTFESYAGGKTRVGMGEARWRYPKDDEFKGLEVKRGEGDWKKAGKGDQNAVFGRHSGLADLGG